MQTLILTDSEADLMVAAELLRKGELVVFPTETVYGLGANGLSEAAVAGIFLAKGRPADNPLILHIANIHELQHIAAPLSENARKLVEVFWPGPLTLVLKCLEGVPTNVTAGLSTVAVRMPSLDVARTLIDLAGMPIAAPSANISGKPSPTCARDVLEDMDGKVAAVINLDRIDLGLESTVLDCTSTPFKLLRPGAVTVAQLEAVVGKIDIDASIDTGRETTTPKSPGMKYKHYAPQAEMYVLENMTMECMAEFLKNKAADAQVGLLISCELKKLLDLGGAYVKAWSTQPELAKNLYTSLREFDRAGVQKIYAQGVPAVGLGLAIMNRMRKSASFNIIQSNS